MNKTSLAGSVVSVMPRGRPHASWLRQVEAYLKDTGMAGLASAWVMARMRPKEYRRKVDGRRGITVAWWTRRRAAPVYATIPDLT